jgi:hypothetical protein
VIGDQGMVKRDARTSPSSRYSFGTRPSQRNRLTARWAHRLESLCSDQPRPACRGTRTFLLCAKRAFPPFLPRFECERSLLWCRDQERLGIMRRVAIDQYRITANIAPQMSIITSRSDAVRDGTKD